jgi:uncharacterized membrane protein YhaH (DUF805 family)
MNLPRRPRRGGEKGWANMTFQQAVKSCFSKYVTFSGRASRSEYWYWVLFATLGSLVALIVDGVLGFGTSGVSPISSIFSLAITLPGIAVGARRMHDMDRTAWWLLLTLTGIGAIVLLIWFCYRGTEGSNRFGPTAA